MARPIRAEASFVGSFVEVFRGRGWNRPRRVIEVTLGDGRYWQDGRYHEGEQVEYTFASLEDARLFANDILREVKFCKAVDA
jgi:hypothetical protein